MLFRKYQEDRLLQLERVTGLRESDSDFPLSDTVRWSPKFGQVAKSGSCP